MVPGLSEQGCVRDDTESSKDESDLGTEISISRILKVRRNKRDYHRNMELGSPSHRNTLLEHGSVNQLSKKRASRGTASTGGVEE